MIKSHLTNHFSKLQKLKSAESSNQHLGIEETMMKKCPYCAEEIQDAAILCRYCGRDLGPSFETSKVVAPQLRVGFDQKIIHTPQSTQYYSKVVAYKSEWEMQHGVAQMQKQGWEVVSTTAVSQGWNGSKTCCLGALFLPLALLGKKKDVHQVAYRRRMETFEELRAKLSSFSFSLDESHDLPSLESFLTRIRSDLQLLGNNMQNAASRELMNILQSREKQAVEKINQIKAENIISELRMYGKELLLADLEHDLGLLKDAPRTTEIEKAKNDSLGLKTKLMGQYHQILTRRVLSGLRSSDVSSPFSNDVEVLANLIGLIEADINELFNYRNIPELSTVMEAAKRKRFAVYGQLYKTKIQQLWRAVFKREKAKEL